MVSPTLTSIPSVPALGNSFGTLVVDGNSDRRELRRAHSDLLCGYPEGSRSEGRVNRGPEATGVDVTIVIRGIRLGLMGRDMVATDQRTLGARSTTSILTLSLVSVGQGRVIVARARDWRGDGERRRVSPQAEHRGVGVPNMTERCMSWRSATVTKVRIAQCGSRALTPRRYRSGQPTRSGTESLRKQRFV